MLPSDFRVQMQAILGAEMSDFEVALQQVPPVSVRLNAAKNTETLNHWNDAVPWCSTGRYLPKRPIFTLDPLFQAGAYYVQEASSMLVEYALRETVDVENPLRVLDLCAAPGGKTTLLAAALHPQSLLLCNEVIKSRVGILKENVQKWGLPNVHVSHHDPEDFDKLTGFFDVILTDAPCSGEGLFRKDPAAANEWSAESVQLCAGRQRRILTAAAPLLKPNGVLIYCTCTYNATENQENGRFLTQELGFEELPLEIPEAWGVVRQSFGYQCYPHRVRGEGFFMGVFKKTSGDELRTSVYAFRSMKPLHHKDARLVQGWLQEPDLYELYIKPNQEIVAVLASQIEDLKILDKALSAKGLGVEIGVLKGQDFIPSHELALSTALAVQVPRVELTTEKALQFLRKEPIALDAPKGWLLVTHQGLGLGWLKNLGNRTNNYLPKEWRIRMEVED
jgi:16S rRNA C967 or C1407 C5-methylase (RsmB/RsmF family)/NOL1/NOP2/fmu family ribosome biogenesis protein